MRTFDDALRFSTMMALFVVVLRFDGAGNLAHWIWWECVLLSLLPLGVFFAAFLMALIAAFFTSLTAKKGVRK